MPQLKSHILVTSGIVLYYAFAFLLSSAIIKSAIAAGTSAATSMKNATNATNATNVTRIGALDYCNSTVVQGLARHIGYQRELLTNLREAFVGLGLEVTVDVHKLLQLNETMHNADYEIQLAEFELTSLDGLGEYLNKNSKWLSMKSAVIRETFWMYNLQQSFIEEASRNQSDPTRMVGIAKELHKYFDKIGKMEKELEIKRSRIRFTYDFLKREKARKREEARMRYTRSWGDI